MIIKTSIIQYICLTIPDQTEHAKIFWLNKVPFGQTWVNISLPTKIINKHFKYQQRDINLYFFIQKHFYAFVGLCVCDVCNAFYIFHVGLWSLMQIHIYHYSSLHIYLLMCF